MSNQHFKGKVLTIISDCSYSGSWVKEGMAFMDEQGVGPCGHVAKEKGILVKVFASCLANEIPAELAFSTHSGKNDTKTGRITVAKGSGSRKRFMMVSTQLEWIIPGFDARTRSISPALWLLGPPGNNGTLLR